MANKKLWLGILVIVLVFGITVVGCSSVTPVYYNFGDVSIGNSAQVVVSPITETGSEFLITAENSNIYVKDVKINGQGGLDQWKRPRNIMIGEYSTSIVRIPPGEHTFTFIFNPGILNAYTRAITSDDMSINITYNVKEGMGYTFRFLATQKGDSPTSPVTALIVIRESPIDENGKFTNEIEVGRHQETFFVSTDAGIYIN